MNDPKQMWQQRYAEQAFAYGTAPNDFLAENVGKITGKKVLCVAEGEGRNGVFLAEHGFEVCAVDFAQAGKEKAAKLASQRGVSLEYHVADLNDFDMDENQWDAIILIFAHFPTALRNKVHANCVRALAPGGVIILEGYHTQQLSLGTGGPNKEEMLFTPQLLLQDFSDLTTGMCDLAVRDIQEGHYHNGQSAVVRYIGCKPRVVNGVE